MFYLRQVVQRIDPLIVVVDAEVEMATRGVTRRTFPSDRLAAMDCLAVADREAGHVPVERFPPVAVDDDDVVAVAVIHVRLDVRDARVARVDVVPAGAGNVESVMEVALRAIGVVRLEAERRAAEPLRDWPAVRPYKASAATAGRECRRLLLLKLCDLRVQGIVGSFHLLLSDLVLGLRPGKVVKRRLLHRALAAEL